MRGAALIAGLVLSVAACGSDDAATPPRSSAPIVGGCADVIAAEASIDGDGTYTFRVTVRSADTRADKYADAWEVRSPDGTVLGTRILTHPHENEQPFTRSQSGIAIPQDINEVTVAARDTVVGFCGETITVRL